MQPGDIVFFTQAKTSSARKAPEMRFKGNAFGLLLGIVPPFQKDPPPGIILRMLGTHGFISFDDVSEFLGPEAQAEVIRKFEDKYYGKVVDPDQQEMTLAPSSLVGADGVPFQKDPEGPRAAPGLPEPA